MVRPTDEEIISIGRIVCYLELLRARDMPLHRDLRVSQEAEGEGETVDQSLVLVSAGRNGQGRVSKLKAGKFEILQQALGHRCCP